MIRFPVCLALAELLACTCFAQQITRQEVSLGVTASTDQPSGGTPLASYYSRLGYVGPQLRYTFNASRYLAVESQISDSVNGLTISLHEGGHQLLALGGVKAGLRVRRFGLFGTAHAGVTSFSHTLQAEGLNPITFGHTTHFTWEQGVALEYSPRPRTFLRLDFDQLIQAEFQRTYFRSPFLIVPSFGVVPDHASVSFSVGHRFGQLQDLDTNAPEVHPQPYSVGALYVTQLREHLLDWDVRSEGGGGAWIGGPAYRWLSLDAVAYDLPHNDNTANSQDGGSTFAAFVGPKAGFHLGPFGLFAKMRPGIMRFSRTNDSQLFNGTTTLIGNRPLVDFALDAGGVLEFTPPTRSLRRAVLRFEGGGTHVWYGSTNVTIGTIAAPQLYPVASQSHNTLLLLTGVGFRF